MIIECNLSQLISFLLLLWKYFGRKKNYSIINIDRSFNIMHRNLVEDPSFQKKEGGGKRKRRQSQSWRRKKHITKQKKRTQSNAMECQFKKNLMKLNVKCTNVLMILIKYNTLVLNALQAHGRARTSPLHFVILCIGSSFLFFFFSFSTDTHK